MNTCYCGHEEDEHDLETGECQARRCSCINYSSEDEYEPHLSPLEALDEFHEVQPDVCRTPCGECPWRRNAMPGHLGPHDAVKWSEMAHSDAPIACHQTIEVSGHWTPNTKQCSGAAIFRTNVMKSPRDPDVATMPADRDRVFGTSREFIDHHEPGLTDEQIRARIFLNMGMS